MSSAAAAAPSPPTQQHTPDAAGSGTAKGGRLHDGSTAAPPAGAAPATQSTPLSMAALISKAERLGESAGAMYFSKHILDTMPTDKLPEEPSSSDVVYRHIKDMRLFDCNPRLNLATYLSSWMEEPAEKLIMESLGVNQADSVMYKSTNAMETRCVAMLADLFHARAEDKPVGCGTIGSTEACLLGGLNLLKHWRDARRAAGKPTDRPNFVCNAAYQVCWEKFSKYWDVEMRTVPLRDGHYAMDAQDVEPLVDENTAFLVAIAGNTYTGHYDHVSDLDALCGRLREGDPDTFGHLRIHVDGASGGLVAPFLYPDLQWDFVLPNVTSISVSGHKYGFVYPGIGWQVWRSEAVLHSDLVFHISYLGTSQRNMTMNFSRPACTIVASYYQFLRLGRAGYTLAMHNMQQVALHLASGLSDTGAFRLINDNHSTVPIVVFSLKPGADGGPRPYTEFEVSDQLKAVGGWSVPPYKLAPDCCGTTVLRAVIREDFSRVMADALLSDVRDALAWLDAHFSSHKREERDAAAEKLAQANYQPARAPSHALKNPKQHVVC